MCSVGIRTLSIEVLAMMCKMFEKIEKFDFEQMSVWFIRYYKARTFVIFFYFSLYAIEKVVYRFFFFVINSRDKYNGIVFF